MEDVPGICCIVRSGKGNIEPRVTKEIGEEKTSKILSAGMEAQILLSDKKRDENSGILSSATAEAVRSVNSHEPSS